jgi:hypothetical protein
MSTHENPDPRSAIINAIRAKRERKSTIAEDIAAIEEALLADIEAFDLAAEEQRARQEELATPERGITEPGTLFPDIVAGGAERARPAAVPTTPPPPVVSTPGLSLLDQLRQQAEIRQHQENQATAERTAANEAIDRGLKQLFFYLHDLVQQLNILKPQIPRTYPLVDQQTLGPLAWREGFADYRTQSQAAGALVEQVSFSYGLTGSGELVIERDGPVAERFRSLLFDYGLQFTCKEFRNARRYVERAEFQVQSELSVSTRWRADFASGSIVLETRNLERLGSLSYAVRPQAVDQALFEEFGRLVLGQPNRFRELAKRT